MKQSGLPAYEYILVTDSQELDAVLSRLGIVQFADEVTAALVAIGEGDYEKVYLTSGSNMKRSADWDWELPEYFADVIQEELDLQDVQEDWDIGA